jgi:hypothetical protein
MPVTRLRALPMLAAVDTNATGGKIAGRDKHGPTGTPERRDCLQATIGRQNNGSNPSISR